MSGARPRCPAGVRAVMIQVRADGSGSVEAAADIANVAGASAGVVIEHSEAGSVTYGGRQLLTFGVELYELWHDHAAQRLRLRMPDGAIPVRGSTTARPRRALIGDPEGEAFLQMA